MRGSRKVAAARRRWLTRAVLVLAVVTGLVAMHELGQPVVAACHGKAEGGDPSSSVVQVSHSSSDHSHRGQHGSGQHVAWVGHGGLCQPLLPVWLSWLPMLACVALISLATVREPGASATERGRAQRRAWWRAPPWAGRVCLQRVCVSRT